MGSATLVVERLAPNVLVVRHGDEPSPGAPRGLPAGVSVLVTKDAGRTPAEVAAVLGELALEEFVLVPAAGVATHAWLAEVALRAGRDMAFCTGWSAYRPFPAVLSQPERGGDQQILDIAQAPPGWSRDGNRGYRCEDVLAEVVPSGLVVRGPEGPPADGVLPFNPAGWTLYIGVPGEPAGLAVVAAAERLLDWLGPEQRAAAKARVLGELDSEARDALARSVREFRPSAKPKPATTPTLVTTLGPASAPKPVPTPRSLPDQEPVSRPESALKAAPAATPESALRPEPPTPDPVLKPETAPTPVRAFATVPPIATMSSAPVSTVSNGVPPEEPRRSEPTPEPVQEPEPALAREPEPEVVVPPAQPRTDPLSIPDRISTAAEQTRFTAAAGDAFGEALASVNTALATWPSLREGATAGFKADLVAVCLYLSRDQAARVNAAVRGGLPAPVDAHIPCLASGIRRLPTHRRAVLRQSVDAAEYRTAPGTLLTEPGFLTASMDLDITVPGAEVDVLIWPASARRTAELMVGRPVNEAVFVAGARFKALAVRTAKDGEDGEDDPEGPAAPRTAALFRELAPSEQPSGAELDERDHAVLAKLDRILARRQQATLRLVDDPDLVRRLTSELVEHHPARTSHTAAAS